VHGTAVVDDGVEEHEAGERCMENPDCDVPDDRHRRSRAVGRHATYFSISDLTGSSVFAS
jgi:hypothetical protein